VHTTKLSQTLASHGARFYRSCRNGTNIPGSQTTCFLSQDEKHDTRVHKDVSSVFPSKTFENSAMGSLQPIEHPKIALSMLCLDFVDGLPESTNGNNKVLLIRDKCSKFVRYLIGKLTDTAEIWTQRYFDEIFRDWGLPDTMISDQDSKFTDLAFTAAHHSAANDQAERTIQTFIQAIRCVLGGRYDQSKWEEVMPAVQLSMNSTINASTKATPFSFLYGREAETAFGETATDIPDFLQRRKDLRDEAADAVAIAQTRMKIYYDSTHTPSKLKVRVPQD
jgi:hypothetical protein